MSKKRAFVRYTKSGKIVPGSLILTNGSYPGGSSTWGEVAVDLCCEQPPVPCPCMSFTLSNSPENQDPVLASYVDCNGVIQTVTLDANGGSQTVCGRSIAQPTESPVAVIVNWLEPCSTTTSTTLPI